MVNVKSLLSSFGFLKVLYGDRFDDAQLETARQIADVLPTEEQKRVRDEIVYHLVRARTLLVGLADDLPKLPLMVARIELDKASVGVCGHIRDAVGLEGQEFKPAM